MTLFAAVRCVRIKNIGHLRQSEAHAKRADDTSQMRVDASRTALNLAASPYRPDAPLGLVDAFRAFKSATGACEGSKNSAIGLHVLCVISPELVTQSGDLHDPNNPVNRQIFNQAQEWAKATFGTDSLVAARMDMDEAGGGVVDLFVCPTAVKQGGRGRKPKLTISTRDALMSIQRQHGAMLSFSALQDSWADHAQRHIDPRLERGKPKAETQRQHVHADVLREQGAKAAAALREAEKIRSLAKDEAFEARIDAKLAETEIEAKRAAAEAEIEAKRQSLTQYENKLRDAAKKMEEYRQTIIQEHKALVTERAEIAKERTALQRLADHYMSVINPLIEYAQEVRVWAQAYRRHLKPPTAADQAFEAAQQILDRVKVDDAALHRLQERRDHHDRDGHSKGPQPK